MVLAKGLSLTRRRTLVETARRGGDLDPDEAMAVRVVEYEIPDRDGANETICLVTTVLDPADIPAPLLAAAFHERWQKGTGNGEVKTTLRGAGGILRSKSSEMVRQEVWAILLTHHAIRKVMTDAAEEADADPDRLSFIRALRVIRRHITGRRIFSLATRENRRPCLPRHPPRNPIHHRTCPVSSNEPATTVTSSNATPTPSPVTPDRQRSSFRESPNSMALAR